MVFLIAGLFSAGSTFAPLFSEKPAAGQQREGPERGSPPALTSERGLAMATKVQGTEVRVWRDGAFRTMFWAGVNLGSSVPGHEPGAVAASRADYERWFTEMGALGITTIRVYTILNPSFYSSLRAHNLRNPQRPLYVLHGVWIPEERFHKVRDIWDPQVTREMKTELRHAVAAVHGDVDIPGVPGHARGSYRADISPWMLGWSFGIEWDPDASHATILKHRTMAPYRGSYIRAKAGANAMESWIAMQLDTIAQLEAARGVSTPLTFTNWDTTDPLRHPAEPLIQEDLVSIDAMKLEATRNWPAGYFASFHAYPYYPDFLRWEPKYQRYKRPRDGKIDPYAGYIADLRRHHRGIPLMITEFGQPTSLGCAHRAPLGRDQGCHSEQEAAGHIVEMMDDLHDEGLAGGIVFMWLDEWFKFTWNTIDYELPGNRRSLWRSPFTNEEHFGIVAAEPGPADTVVIDGKDEEWADAPSIGTGSGSVSDVRATSDAEHIYLRLRVTPELWRSKRIVIGLDAHESGNRGLPGTDGKDTAADMAVVIGPGARARIFHATWLDPLSMRFGGHANPKKDFLPVRRADIEEGSGSWTPVRQILNYPYRLPLTGKMNPTEWRDASTLPWGTTDPTSPAFDDRNMLMGGDQILEVAIPWGMMTFADPSSHRVYEFRLVPDAKKQVVTRKIGRLGISIAVDGEPLLRTSGYRWDGWDEVTWHERRKAGWPLLLKMFERYRGPLAAPPAPAG